MTYTESIEPQDTVCLVLLWGLGLHCVLLKSLPREAVSTPFPRSQWQIASFHRRTRVYLNFSTTHRWGVPSPKQVTPKKKLSSSSEDCPPSPTGKVPVPLYTLVCPQGLYSYCELHRTPGEVVEKWSDRKVIVSWPSLALHDGGKQSRKTQLG